VDNRRVRSGSFTAVYILNEQKLIELVCLAPEYRIERFIALGLCQLVWTNSLTAMANFGRQQGGFEKRQRSFHLRVLKRFYYVVIKKRSASHLIS
jgi:hypothetical protein